MPSVIYSAYGAINGNTTVITYSFSWYSPYEDTIENLHGARLAAYLHNNFGSHLFVPKIYYKGRRRRRSRLFCTTECPLTGYYMDKMILDPIYCFFTHPDNTTFYDLIECCSGHLFRACRDDARYAAARSISQNWLKVTHGNTLPAVQHII